MTLNSYDYSVLGLEPRDIRVYETLYRLTKGSLRSVAGSTGLNRGTVYEIIKKLSALGLVSYTQVGSRKHYVAADPEVFQSLITEQRDHLQKLESNIKNYADDLRSQIPQKGPVYSAQFYESEEGVSAILRDVLQTVRHLDEKQYEVFSSKRVSSFIYNNYKSYTRQRIKLGIFVKVIANVNTGDSSPLSERRQILPGRTPLDGYIIIYGDKTAMISLSETNELSGIVVTDKGTTAMHRVIFEQLWNSSKKSNKVSGNNVPGV